MDFSWTNLVYFEIITIVTIFLFFKLGQHSMRSIGGVNSSFITKIKSRNAPRGKGWGKNLIKINRERPTVPYRRSRCPSCDTGTQTRQIHRKQTFKIGFATTLLYCHFYDRMAWEISRRFCHAGSWEGVPADFMFVFVAVIRECSRRVRCRVMVAADRTKHCLRLKKIGD